MNVYKMYDVLLDLRSYVDLYLQYTGKNRKEKTKQT